MTLHKDDEERTIASIKQFSLEEFEMELGELKARRLLEFFFKELAPLAYNKGVQDSESYFRRSLEDLSATVFEPAYTFRSVSKKR